MLTLVQAQTLRHGQTLAHATLKDSKGNPLIARVSGKVQLWKTRPQAFKLPMKHGLYQSFYITETNANEWSV